MGAFGQFLGRLTLASLFLISGASKFVQLAPVVTYAMPKIDSALRHLTELTGVKLPLEPWHYVALILAAGCLELLGGILFTLNVRLGAALLLLFLVPTTAVMHNFWEMEDGSSAHQIEFVQFCKNVCLAGAFLMYLATPKPSAYAPAAKVKSL